MKAVTHIHTAHSWDSLLSPSRLVRALITKGVELALITDHNSFAGALEARAYVAQQGLALEVPIAAEIRTDLGDVIVVVPDDQVPAIEDLLRWDDLQSEIRSRDGLVWLPHPYRSHSDDAAEEIGAAADLIEVFNSRCDAEQNRRALDLCERHGKVPTVGMDVHLAREATRWTVEYEHCESPLATIAQAPTWRQPTYSRRADFHAAQMIPSLRFIRKQLERRQFRGIPYHGLRVGYLAARVVQSWLMDQIRGI